ncbi:hypothetical protein [Mucilaginibacter sp. HD30]
METQNKQDQQIKNGNQAVEKAYQAIIKEVKTVLASFPTEELRTYVERKGTNNDSQSFYCPMAYISVAENFGKRVISFAKNAKAKPHIGPILDTVIPRIIYKQTAVESSKINIEDRVEEYTYQYSKFDDALKYAASLENYKKHTVHPMQEA